MDWNSICHFLEHLSNFFIWIVSVVCCCAFRYAMYLDKWKNYDGRGKVYVIPNNGLRQFKRAQDFYVRRLNILIQVFNYFHTFHEDKYSIAMRKLRLLFELDRKDLETFVEKVENRLGIQNCSKIVYFCFRPTRRHPFCWWPWLCTCKLHVNYS